MEGNTLKRKHSRIRTAAVIALVVAFLFALMWFLQCLLMPKYMKGIIEGAMTAEYYDSKEPHEVIFIGDCEVYENISTAELYRKYGISSYIRGSAQQLAWQSYYLLEDTLRYEKPKVVIFNVLALKYDKPQKDTYNRMTLDGMRWSSSKVDAIKASMTEDESFIEYLFPILKYHSRWNELTSDDWKYLFSHDRVTTNGYYMRVDIRPQKEFPPAPRLTDYTLGENAMSYLRKMASLCRENDIELVLIKAPTEYPYWYDEWDAQIVDFARKWGLTYINYQDLKDEVGLDMTTDTYDEGLHLNIYGAEKMADHIGAFLVENYDLTDYREVPEVAALWEENLRFYDDLRAAQQKELDEYGELRSWGIGAVEN